MPEEEPGRNAGEDDHGGLEEEPAGATLPRWVPVLIGIILVAMAGLAVFTGWRYRGSRVRPQTFVDLVHPSPRPAKVIEGGPPGEPEPGASRVAHGAAGADTPVAGPLDTAPRSRVTLEGGGAAGILPTIRISARRGMVLDVEPADALVWVNGGLIGPATQFHKPDESYDFPEEGSYTIRITAPGYQDVEYAVNVSSAAREEVAEISIQLEKK
ncbi:MAG: hypothetical protein WBX15_09055 [Thermoanaerobaculia bacterium]